MEKNNEEANLKLRKKDYVPAAILALGLFCLGIFIYWGLNNISSRDRVVSVRGLAERDVKADLVTWPLAYKTSGNDLIALYDRLTGSNNAIIAFLRQNGIPESEISVTAPKITDKKADAYGSGDNIGDRYSVTSVILVKSKKVDLVRNLMSHTDELMKEGVAITAGDYDTNVQYEFTSLNSIKPEMIHEATENARKAATQFANDSQSKVGGIKNASQGLFSIDDRDKFTPYVKHIRVVTTIDYFLK